MFVSVSERASKLESKVKQTWRFVFLLPKNECFIILASCTTLSVLCKSFQRTLSFTISNSSLSHFAWGFVRSRKRMQRYDFFPNHQNFRWKNVSKCIYFNRYLQFISCFMPVHIIIYITCHNISHNQYIHDKVNYA